MSQTNTNTNTGAINTNQNQNAGRGGRGRGGSSSLCYRSDNGGLSFKPYKNVVEVKLLNNFSNVKPNDPHWFKEELKIKYNAILAVARKFPSGTGRMLELLAAEVHYWIGLLIFQ